MNKQELKYRIERQEFWIKTKRNEIKKLEESLKLLRSFYRDSGYNRRQISELTKSQKEEISNYKEELKQLREKLKYLKAQYKGF
jgi:phage-related tail protein